MRVSVSSSTLVVKHANLHRTDADRQRGARLEVGYLHRRVGVAKRDPPDSLGEHADPQIPKVSSVSDAADSGMGACCK